MKADYSYYLMIGVASLGIAGGIGFVITVILKAIT